MMELLERYSEEGSIYRPALALTESKLLSRKTVPSLTAITEKDLDIQAFMGRWHVLASIPSSVERNTFDNYENYVYGSDAKKDIAITFQYTSLDDLNKQNEMKMKARIFNSPTNTHWKLNIKYGITWPIDLNYLVHDIVKDANGEYLYTIVGVTDRSALWIMTKLKPKTTHPKLKGKTFPFSSRVAKLTEEQQKAILKAAIEKIESLGYDSSRLILVPYSDDA